MSACASCGLQMANGSELCRHHVPDEVGWAEANRIMCDFFHRKMPPRRLAPDRRADEFWSHAGAA